MNIYVANLAPDVNEEMLKVLFLPYGDVENVRLMVDLQTNISKGYAFVTMVDDEMAMNAIHQLNGTLLNSKKIAVREAGKSVENNLVVSKPVKHSETKPDFSIFEGLQLKGIVKFFDEKKGFGFILLENQHELFFHFSALPENMPNPQSGLPVLFNIQFTKKGFVATNLMFEIADNQD
ncbi:MAG: cold shock domain-containing protein [Bacteroidales bacterium]|nr:cold shock domain-containing protein [Bacteroidales bacterium]